ncbi:hypothetical protein PT974_06865 [Cladobotryum mycophilum]|uniref:N-acetyltransferase domain-containing protein n=1 Tax=Cladobotryum mycophilum TaxID=491253 RepID=A0ABR0SMV2_9HYPO
MADRVLRPRLRLDHRHGSVIVETPNLILRRWRMIDATAFARAANYDTLGDTLMDHFPAPFTVHHARAYLRNRASEFRKDVSTLAIVKKPRTDHNRAGRPKLVGEIQFLDHDESYYRTWEMTWWTSPPVQSRALDLEMLNGIVPFVFDVWPMLNRLEVSVPSCDAHKHRPLSQFGFILESKRKGALEKAGQMISEYIYRFLREDYDREMGGAEAR